MITALRLGLLITIACACPACTAGLWQGALSSHWTDPRVCAVMAEQDGPPHTIIVQYSRPRMHACEYTYAVVPVDYDARNDPQPLRTQAYIKVPAGQELRGVDSTWPGSDEPEGTDAVRVGYAFLAAEDWRAAIRGPTTFGPSMAGLLPRGHANDPSHEVVVARRIPRPAAERTVSVLAAVVATPATLAADAVLLPTALLLVGALVPGGGH